MAATEHSGSGDLSRSMALLWGLEERGRRGPKPAISLERIVDTAIRIADAEGLEAVSMRKIAGCLGVGTMSLYRHVPGKAELLDLMLDKVGAVDPDEAARFESRPWRERLAHMARGYWDYYLRHPWLLQVDQARPVLGPNGLYGLEVALAGFAGLPLTDREKMGVISTVDALASGLARMHVNAVRAEERTGISDTEFWEAQRPAVEKAMKSGTYPRVAALTEDAFSEPGEQVFTAAVERLLDGLDALFTRRAEEGWRARPGDPLLGGCAPQEAETPP